MNFTKNKTLNIILTVLLFLVVGVVAFLIPFYPGLILGPIFIVPGFIAFFGQALNNGGKV